ncbi:DUF7522 family protein [Haloprofundus halophilus]|uniref:DUF7522 family protein n=1 Tax=Haloprofundus halophilus TaxID=2283527 RepID=UPI000E43D4A4|nr:hypothetical protein [Haloprofundus halophilus]
MASRPSDDFADSIVYLVRTALGDALRSVIYFTPDEFEVLYLRSGLYADDPSRVRSVKEPLVENERLGFSSQETYQDLFGDESTEPDIGEYEYTIRVFSKGFVCRVLVDDHGVIVTTDELDIAEFEAQAVSLRSLLATENRT